MPRRRSAANRKVHTKVHTFSHTMRLCGSLLLVIGHSSANVASCKTPCCAAERRPFLITGCGRCGSHAIARLFIQSGLDVRHEELGVDGAVHWGWAWWRDSLRGRALPAPFQTKERRSAVRYTDPDFRFRVVAHYVRHPLTSVQSLEKCFCGSPSRASVNGSKIDPVSEASYRIVATHQPGLPSGATHRAMFYWHATNAYLETRSDFRFRVEAVNTSELVGALGYNLSDDAVARSCADERASSSTRAAPSVSSSATWQHEWGRLAAVNSSLAQAMRAAALFVRSSILTSNAGGGDSVWLRPRLASGVQRRSVPIETQGARFAVRLRGR